MDFRSLVKLLGLAVLAIGVMAVSASGAQAKYLLLLNKASVGSLTLTLTQVGPSSIHAANGKEIICKGGSGTVTAGLSGAATQVTGNYNATFTGCEWAPPDGVCHINDGGVGIIKASAAGELIMDGSNYIMTASSATFATVKSEGEFCILPSKLVISGGAHALINNALADATSHTATFLNLNLKLDSSSVTSLKATDEVKDSAAAATLGVHLEKLKGCETIC